MSMMSVAASGLQSQLTKLDALSNNIANLDTTGYQRESVTFGDTLTQVYGQAAATNTANNNRLTPLGLSLGTGSYAEPMTQQFQAGSYKATQNPLDMAIQGDGFFTIRLANGQTGYTRAGDFSLSKAANGHFYLATKAGDPVLSSTGQPIDVTSINATTLHVSPDGSLTADTLQGKPVALPKLGLAYVAHPENALASVGADTYQANPGYTVATNAQLGTRASSVIGSVQGSMLETSNVNLTQEMSSLITTQHDFQMSSQAVNIADKMMGVADTLA